MTDKIIAYKGFDQDFKCRGFQYEVGNTYLHEGAVKPCVSGFHSCADPWDVLKYYDITSRFSIVELGGETKTHNDDSKIASAEITIKAELKLPEFISKLIDRLLDSNKGHSSQLAESGHSSQIAASGDYSQLAASGYSSQLAASGDSSQLAASGDSSQLAASGDSSQLAASGDYSKLAASGDSSKLAASGHYSQLAASGHYSIVCAAGLYSKIKGGKNCAMSLARWIEPEKRYRISVAYVGENGIKEDTWYKLDDEGNFVEC